MRDRPRRGPERPRAGPRRAVQVWRAEGLRSVLLRALGATVYRRLLVLERPFAGGIPRVEPRIPVTFERLGPADVGEYLELRPDARRAELDHRFELGQYLFAARHDGRIVAACWVADKRAYIEYLDRWVRLAPRVGYLYEVYVRPEERGKRIDRALYSHMFDFFGARDLCDTLMATAHIENRTALLFERIGFRPAALLGCLKLGPWRRVLTELDPAQTVLLEHGRERELADSRKAA